MKVHTPLVIAAILFCSCSRPELMKESNSPKTNIEVMENLSRVLALTLAHQTDMVAHETCAVRAVRVNEFDVITQGFLEGLSEFPCVTLTDSLYTPSSKSIEVRPLNAFVRYSNAHRTGFFGTKKVERTVSVQLSIMMTHPRTGVVIFAGILSDYRSDSIAVEMINQVETPSLSFTKGELPQDAFFDRILEPIIVIGATALVVYLFFTVRS